MAASRLPACLLLAGMGCVVLAAEPQEPGKAPRFRSAIDLTTVNATVVSKEKGLMTGLPQDLLRALTTPAPIAGLT